MTSIDRTGFDCWFEDFLSNLPLKTIIYCVTDQPSITRSRGSVLNFNLFVLTFSRSMPELLDEHWAKIVQSEYISTPIYVECWKMYWSKVWVKKFSYFVSGLDIQLEQQSCLQKFVAIGEIWLFIYSFFGKLIQAYGLVVKGELQTVGRLGLWFLMSAETLCSPPAFCMALSLPVHWHSRFYILLRFCQWLSRADRVVNLNTTILLSL